jgi:hypothetical protein
LRKKKNSEGENASLLDDVKPQWETPVLPARLSLTIDKTTNR